MAINGPMDDVVRHFLGLPPEDSRGRKAAEYIDVIVDEKRAGLVINCSREIEGETVTVTDTDGNVTTTTRGGVTNAVGKKSLERIMEATSAKAEASRNV